MESISRGLKPRSLRTPSNVRAEARTYLRNNSKDSLDVEFEEEDVAVFDYVFFAFGA